MGRLNELRSALKRTWQVAVNIGRLLSISLFFFVFNVSLDKKAHSTVPQIIRLVRIENDKRSLFSNAIKISQEHILSMSNGG